MEETKDTPNEDKDNAEKETSKDSENASCIYVETNKLDEQNDNETVNSHDVKLKEEEENNSNTKDCVTAVKDNVKGDEPKGVFEKEVRNEEFEKDIEILEEDDKDQIKNLNANDDDKNIDRKEGKTTEDGKSLSEIENLNQNDDNKDMKLDDGDFEDKDVVSGDGQTFKKYRLRQRQSVRYTFDEPPPKKEKVNKNEDDKNTDYECPICYATCKSKRGLSVHISFHEQAQKFTCAQCSMEFVTNKQLIDHKKVHETDGTIYSCQRCKVAYSNFMEYLLHKADHNKPRVEVNCEECGKEFNNKNLYKVHLPTHFSFTQNCEICNKTIKNRLNYIQHMKAHENKKKYICGECDKECDSKYYLDYHMATHTGVKLHQCLYCGKGFYKNLHRKIHTRIHTGERPFQCKICKKTFRQYTDYQRHIIHHDAEKVKFICDHCGKAYSQKTSLATHMRIHTRKNLLSCPICNKKFPAHALLKSHYIYNHTTDKPFKCDTCKVSFKRLNHLQRHLKVRKHKNSLFGQLKKLKRKENETNIDGGQKAGK